MFELELITQYYGEKRAARSQVLFINHIQEGLVILDRIGAHELSKRTYCLHPLVQADEDLRNNYPSLIAHPEASLRQSLPLAMEYRYIANSYLSQHEPPEGGIHLSPIPFVNEALIADKVQNRKDFERYHKESHANSERLDAYFKRWLSALNVSEARYQELIAGL
jgi:hypothetical protein